MCVIDYCSSKNKNDDNECYVIKLCLSLKMIAIEGIKKALYFELNCFLYKSDKF